MYTFVRPYVLGALLAITAATTLVIHRPAHALDSDTSKKLENAFKACLETNWWSYQDCCILTGGVYRKEPDGNGHRCSWDVGARRGRLGLANLPQAAVVTRAPTGTSQGGIPTAVNGSRTTIIGSRTTTLGR